jgi:hypothetical protein
MRHAIRSLHFHSAQGTLDTLERTSGVVRLEVAPVRAEQVRPRASELVLQALDTQLPHHALHERIRREATVRERSLAHRTFTLRKPVHTGGHTT